MNIVIKVLIGAAVGGVVAGAYKMTQGWLRLRAEKKQLLEALSALPTEELQKLAEEELLRLLAEDLGVIPNNKFVLGLWLFGQASSRCLAAFDLIEERIGEREANLWLARVLAKSGKYKTDAEGNVWTVH